MTRRKQQRVVVRLDPSGVMSLSKGEIAAILRGADAMIARGGRTQLAKLLKGSREASILEHGLDRCPSYGFYRDLTIEQILHRIDRALEDRYLAIVYSGRLPVLVFTPLGWSIEIETMADEELRRFEERSTAGPPYDFHDLKDRNRELIMRLLEKVEASARPQMIPLLRAWAEIDYKKVRARIAAVIRSIESKGGAVGGAAQADTNELIDVLDPAGHPTGLAKPKHAIHSEGAWHRAVHLWIVTPDRSVLLQRRSFAKMAWPGWWDISVAGHLSAGESAADAAVREAREELGLDLRTEELVPLATVREQSVFDDGRWIENEIQEVYVVRRYIDLRSLSPDHAEVIDLMLVSMGDLDRADIVPHVGEIEALLRFVEAI